MPFVGQGGTFNSLKRLAVNLETVSVSSAQSLAEVSDQKWAKRKNMIRTWRNSFFVVVVSNGNICYLKAEGRRAQKPIWIVVDVALIDLFIVNFFFRVARHIVQSTDDEVGGVGGSTSWHSADDIDIGGRDGAGWKSELFLFGRT